MPGDFLPIRLLNLDEIIDKDDEDGNWADPGARRSGRSLPSDGNDNDNSNGQEDTQGGKNGTGTEMGTKAGYGKRKVKGNAMVEGKGMGL